MLGAESASLRFRYTRNDYLAAMGTRYSRTTRAKMSLVGSLLVIGLGILSITFIQNPYLLVLGPYLVGLGLGALVMTIQHYGLNLGAILGQDVPLGDEQVFTFSADGITLTTPHSSFRADWDHYHDAAETQRVFLLFWAPNVYTLIPKRVFPTAAEATAFRELVQQKIGGLRASA